MCDSDVKQVLIAAAVVLFAGTGTLSAQRYYGRDHHVYHPPAQAKHSSSQPVHSQVHATSTASASNAGHTAGAPNQVPAANSRPDAMTPPNGNEHKPQ